MTRLDAPLPPSTNDSVELSLISHAKRSGPRGNRMGLVALGIILLLATIVLPLASQAATTRAGDSVDVGSTERIDGDFNAVARSVSIAGTITGDANIAGFELDVSGRIDGSATIASVRSTISGTIGGSLRIASGNVDVTGTINGDLVVLGGQVTIPSQARITGDLVVIGGQVDLRGTVTGNAEITSATFTLGGAIQGDANISASTVKILGPGRVGGKLSYTSSSEADIAPNAVVAGATEHSEPTSVTGGRQGIFNPWLRVIWALLAGVILIALAPRAASAIGRSGRRFLRAFGFGLVGLFLIPIAAIILIATIVGLPVGFIVLTLYVIALYLSQVVVGTMIGRLILSSRWDDGSRGFNLLCMTIGVLLISALRFVPIPFVWGGLNTIVAVWGLGTIILLFGRLRPAYVLGESAA